MPLPKQIPVRDVTKEPDFRPMTKAREIATELKFGAIRRWLARKGWILFDIEDTIQTTRVGEKLVLRDRLLQERLLELDGPSPDAFSATGDPDDIGYASNRSYDPMNSPKRSSGGAAVGDVARALAGLGPPDDSYDVISALGLDPTPTVDKLSQFRNGKTETVAHVVHTHETKKGTRRKIKTRKVSVAQFNASVDEYVKERRTSTLITDEFEDVARRELVDDLHKTQDAATLWSRKSPIAKSAVEAHVHYTVGMGLQVLCPSPEVAEFIQQFWDYNDLGKLAKEYFRTFYLNGELFVLHFPRGSGQDYMDSVRWVSPKQITSVITFHDDVNAPLVYRRDIPGLAQVEPIFYPDIWTAISLHRQPEEEITQIDDTPFNWKEAGRRNGFMQYGKFGQLGSIRGYVPMAPVLKYFRYLEDFVTARIILARERSRVIMKQRISPGSREARNLAATTQRFPAHGYMLKEIKGQLEYITESANLGSSDAKSDWEMIVHTIAGGVEVPPMILTQDADATVYASIKTARTPFIQKTMDNREIYGAVFADMIRAAVSFAVDAGRLPETVMVPKHSTEQITRGVESVMHILHKSPRSYEPKELKQMVTEALGPPLELIEVDTKKVPIDADFPDLITESPKEKAEVIQILRNLGLVSKDSAASMINLDWRTEKPKIDAEAEEAKQKQADAAAAFAQGLGDFPDLEEPDEDE